MNEELLTAIEAARMLKLSLPAFYQFRRRQRIQSRGLGRRLLFARADLVRAHSSEPVAVVDFAELARQYVRRGHRRA